MFYCWFDHCIVNSNYTFTGITRIVNILMYPSKCIHTGICYLVYVYKLLGKYVNRKHFRLLFLTDLHVLWPHETEKKKKKEKIFDKPSVHRCRVHMHLRTIPAHKFKIRITERCIVCYSALV